MITVGIERKHDGGVVVRTEHFGGAEMTMDEFGEALAASMNVGECCCFMLYRLPTRAAGSEHGQMALFDTH